MTPKPKKKDQAKYEKRNTDISKERKIRSRARNMTKESTNGSLTMQNSRVKTYIDERAKKTITQEI